MHAHIHIQKLLIDWYIFDRLENTIVGIIIFPQSIWRFWNYSPKYWERRLRIWDLFLSTIYIFPPLPHDQEASFIGMNSEFISFLDRLPNITKYTIFYLKADNNSIHIFPKGIRAMWNVHGLVQDLNWYRRLFFRKLEVLHYDHLLFYVIYVVLSISSQAFFVQAFKIAVDSWTFSTLLLHMLWHDWPIFMIQVQINSYSSNWNTPY